MVRSSRLESLSDICDDTEGMDVEEIQCEGEGDEREGLVFGRAGVLLVLVKDQVSDSDGGSWKEKAYCVIEGKMSKAIGLKNEPRTDLVVKASEAV